MNDIVKMAAAWRTIEEALDTWMYAAGAQHDGQKIEGRRLLKNFRAWMDRLVDNPKAWP